MIIRHQTHEDFKELLDRPLNKHGRKVSLILPARHEHKTIGNYFPEFSKLMQNGCVDEIIIADSSDDMQTIDTALEAAMDTQPFAEMISQAKKRGAPLPVKAVNVFDPRFSGIFNGHKPVRGTSPGKGSAMYLGMAVATGDILLFLDTDFFNIDPRFVYGLAGPFEDPKTVLSKATFDLEDVWQDVVTQCEARGDSIENEELLLKSVNARTLAKPMMKILSDELEMYPGIDGFNGPLSGGCGAAKNIWHSLMIPKHYGIEVSYLMQFVDKFPNGHLAYDVNLGPVEQVSQDAEGRVWMGSNIIGTVLRQIRFENPELYSKWVKNPELCSQMYLNQARSLALHCSDAERMTLYAGIIEDKLREDDADETHEFPPLLRNLYYLEKADELMQRSNEVTAERITKIAEKRHPDKVISIVPQASEEPAVAYGGNAS